MDKSFITIKNSLMTPPVLVFPDFEMKFMVETDASAFSVGEILTEKKGDEKYHRIQLY